MPEKTNKEERHQSSGSTGQPRAASGDNDLLENHLKEKPNTGDYVAPSYQGSTTTSNQGGLESLPGGNPGQGGASSTGD
ncbi:MAG TPA: hypothetical protein VNA17_09870 [Pyrinomonadaceae bacterium]|nr:hypothetical protein [Pyrinomonadaceae bacterium]